MEPLGYEKRGYLNEDFRLFHLADSALSPLCYHYHSFHKLVVLLAGRVDYSVEGRHYALEAGDLVTPCRRLLCSASEDVGMAYPQAVSIVKACVDTAMQLGLPEAQLPLAQACILLATAPKSNSVVAAIDAARADVRAGKSGNIPREMQNVHADGTGFEREQGYKYPHAFPGHWVRQQYLPDSLKNAHYSEYGDNKTEQAAKAYWELIKK